MRSDAVTRTREAAGVRERLPADVMRRLRTDS